MCIHKPQTDQPTTCLEYDPNRQWYIKCNEEQLYDIINAVEDIHRFLSGQTELHNTTSYITPFANRHDVRKRLESLAELVTPEFVENGIYHSGSSYSWDGAGCEDENRRDKVRRTYAIYRNLRHCIESRRPGDEYNVYKSPTLTCGVPLATCFPADEKNLSSN